MWLMSQIISWMISYKTSWCFKHLNDHSDNEDDLLEMVTVKVTSRWHDNCNHLDWVRFRANLSLNFIVACLCLSHDSDCLWCDSPWQICDGNMVCARERFFALFLQANCKGPRKVAVMNSRSALGPLPELVVHLRVVHLVSAKTIRAPLSQPMDGLLLLPHSESSLHLQHRQGFVTQILWWRFFSHSHICPRQSDNLPRSQINVAESDVQSWPLTWKKVIGRGCRLRSKDIVSRLQRIHFRWGSDLVITNVGYWP